jgi:hypothetical protein
MAQPATQSPSQVGPFPAGATLSDLISLATQSQLGLRVLEPEEQARDYSKARCEALESAAREFFFKFDGSSSLIFQKIHESAALPDFIEYVYCWLGDDRLGGLILSGVTSDAGTHEQIDIQENQFWEHAAEVAEALSQKYPQTPNTFINFFNFATYPSPPCLDGAAPADGFTRYDRLVIGTGDDNSGPRVETHFCGPAVVYPTLRKLETKLATAAAHTSQAGRKSFANERFLVSYDFKVERYVRTIESIHAFENLIYLDKDLANDVGKRLNAQECARVQTEAREEIERWKASIAQREDARRARISKLSELL